MSAMNSFSKLKNGLSGKKRSNNNSRMKIQGDK